MRNFRDDSVFEFADLRLVAVATIEEENLIAAFFDQLVDLIRLEVLSTVHNAALVYRDIDGKSKINELRLDLHLEFREVVASSHRPFEIDLSKAGILLSCAHILLQVGHISTQRSIDSMFGDQDSPFES